MFAFRPILFHLGNNNNNNSGDEEKKNCSQFKVVANHSASTWIHGAMNIEITAVTAQRMCAYFFGVLYLLDSFVCATTIIALKTKINAIYSQGFLLSVCLFVCCFSSRFLFIAINNLNKYEREEICEST